MFATATRYLRASCDEEADCWGTRALTAVSWPWCKKTLTSIVTVPPKPHHLKHVWAKTHSGSKSGLRVKICRDLTLRWYVNIYKRANENSFSNQATAATETHRSVFIGSVPRVALVGVRTVNILLLLRHKSTPLVWRTVIYLYNVGFFKARC